MGRDGADGLLALRQAGGLAIAQDQATSIVYGMPRQALLRGAAEDVLPVEDIARALLARAAVRRRRYRARTGAPWGRSPSFSCSCSSRWRRRCWPAASSPPSGSATLLAAVPTGAWAALTVGAGVLVAARLLVVLRTLRSEPRLALTGTRSSASISAIWATRRAWRPPSKSVARNSSTMATARPVAEDPAAEAEDVGVVVLDRARRAVYSSWHRAARTPRTLLAARVSPCPLPPSTMAKSARPATTARPAAAQIGG